VKNVSLTSNCALVAWARDVPEAAMNNSRQDRNGWSFRFRVSPPNVWES
jgi:hypothetical protein